MAKKRAPLATKDGLLNKATPVELVLPARMSYDKWHEAGAVLGTMQRASVWWVCDWLNYGEDHYGEKFAQAVDATGLDPKTIQNYMRVGKSIPPPRRRERLFFAHHEAVATFDADEQRFWLNKAEKGEDGAPWSSKRLRSELKAAGKVTTALPAGDGEGEGELCPTCGKAGYKP